MPTLLNPYLGFTDNAREAMASYHKVFGAKLAMQTFGEAHASQDPAQMNLIMHAQLTADNATKLKGNLGNDPEGATISGHQETNREDVQGAKIYQRIFAPCASSRLTS